MEGVFDEQMMYIYIYILLRIYIYTLLDIKLYRGSIIVARKV